MKYDTKKNLLPNRQNDLYLSKDPNQKYAVTMTYAQQQGDIRWITKGPMTGEQAVKYIDDMLTALENGEWVCIRTQFFNPRNVISVKFNLWKDTDDNSEFD